MPIPDAQDGVGVWGGESGVTSSSDPRQVRLFASFFMLLPVPLQLFPNERSFVPDKLAHLPSSVS